MTTKEEMKEIFVDLTKRQQGDITTKIIPGLIRKISGFLPDCTNALNIKYKDLLWSRRLLLISLHYVNPARIGVISKLTFTTNVNDGNDEDNGSDADIILKDGKWFWAIDHELFMNSQLFKNDYFIPFPTWLSDQFETYIYKYRCLMADGEFHEDGNPICPYVFRPCKKTNGSVTKPISTKSLAADISSATDLCSSLKKSHSPTTLRYLVAAGADAHVKLVGKPSPIHGYIKTDNQYTIEKIKKYYEITEKALKNNLKMN